MNLEEFKTKVDEMHSLKREHEKMKKETSEKHAEFTSVKAEILKIMDAHDLDNFEASNCKISRRVQYSVATPKTAEEKLKLFTYIQAKYGDEVLVGYQGINSQTLQSFFKAENELALDAGNLEFALPGVGKPKERIDLSVRKK